MAKKKKTTSKKRSSENSLKRKQTRKPIKNQVFEQKLFEKGFWKNNYIPALIIFVLGVGLYLRSIPYEYVLDDQIVITKNIYTQKGFGGIWDILTTESFQGYFQSQKDLVVGSRYRPLSIITFAIEYGIVGGFNRQLSHFLNALFYGLCGLLLFRVLSLLLRKYASSKWYLSVGFAAALLWTVHPLHTEAVANIKGRDEILALIGSLGTLYFYLRYFDKGKWLDLLWGCVVFFLGMLAKENTLTFLGVIPLSIYFFQNGNIGKIAKSMIPLLVTFIIYLIIRVQIIGYLLDSGKEITDIMNNPFVNMNLGEKYATIFYTLLLYLKLNIIPYPLTHDYYPFHIPTMNWTQIWPILSLISYLILTVIAVWGIKKRNVFAYGIWFYLMTISIVSNLVFPVGTFMNERFVFMASVGSCIIMAYFLLEYLPKVFPQFKREYLAVAMVILTLAYGYKTFTRIPAWENPLTLNSSAVLVSKNSARANTFMATALFNRYKEMPEGDDKKNILARTRYYADISKNLMPDYQNANIMMAGVVTEEFRYDRDFSKLLEELRKIAVDAPNLKFLYEYYDYLVNTYSSKPELFDYFYDMGKNVLIGQQYKFGIGIQYLQYAERLRPGDPNVIKAIAETYEQIGNSSKAQEYFNKLR